MWEGTTESSTRGSVGDHLKDKSLKVYFFNVTYSQDNKFMTVKQLISKAKNLSPLDRVRLLEALYNTFDNDANDDRIKQWARESEDRIDSYENGSLKTEDYDSFKNLI